MPSNPIESIATSYRLTHKLAIELADDLTDDQLKRRHGAESPSIAFHLWHLARYADAIPAKIGAPGGGLWEEEDMSGRWGFTQASLGVEESGTGMVDDELNEQPWPTRRVLLDYAQRAFAAADAAVGSVDEDRFGRTSTRPDRTVGTVIMINLTHDSRHLGMVEAIRGVIGVTGTATV